jgi:heat-inducible transcriptional repressor
MRVPNQQDAYLLPDRSLLNDRAQNLLKILVERYIDEGQPIGSQALSQDPRISLSSATIRNVMSELENLGFVTSPHTSAGRIPTASGYRLFIDTLLTVQPLERETIQSIKGGLEGLGGQEALLHTASRILSETTRLAGIVSVPKTDAMILRHIEFIPLLDRTILVVLVSNTHEIKNQIINAPRNFSKNELVSAANYINDHFAGKDLSSISSLLIGALAKDRESQNAESLMNITLNTKSQSENKALLITGEVNLMDYSELMGDHQLDQFKSLFRAFHQKEDALGLIQRCMVTPEVKIFIGEEYGHKAMDACSLITSPYYSNGQIVGFLGVVGPTRIPYKKVIPLVDLTAKMVSMALNHENLPPTLED